MKYIIENDDDRNRVLAVISGLSLDEKQQITITGYRKVRSIDQNKKWHAMIGDIAKVMGYTPAEMKCIVLYALGYFHEVQGRQQVLLVYAETHKMTVDDLSTLIEQTYQWSASKGVLLE